MTTDTMPVSTPGAARPRRPWLPDRQQMQNAARLQVADAVDGDALTRQELAGRPATTMQQALGMVVILALVAGALPFLINWIMAARVGTAAPLLDLANALDRESAIRFGAADPLAVVADTARIVAGLETRLPAWLAALLTALGSWISWPMRWLQLWIVYGLGVLTVAKLLGATTTLQRFYAATGYAALPLLLLALTPIPCLGTLAGLVAIAWSLLIFAQAVQYVTGLQTVHLIVAILLPLAAAAMVAVLTAATFFATFAGMVM